MNFPSHGNHSGDRPLLGILMLMASLLAMTVLGGLAKTLAVNFSIAQILLFRYALATLPFLLLLPRNGGIDALRIRNPASLATRTVSGITSLFLFFYAIALIPLADATALAYAAPIFVVILSIPVLGEVIGYRRWIAVGVGFAGVLLITQPGGAGGSVGYLAGIGSAFFGAIVSVWLRRMMPSEQTSTIAIYYNATGAVVFGVWVLITGWTTPGMGDLLLLVMLGALAGPQQYLLTSAYRYGEASMLAPFDYVAMIFAALIGFVFWSEIPALTTWAGCGIIAGSGIFVAYRERRATRGER